MLYYPWWQECDLLGPDNKYSTKLEDLSVKSVVQRNHAAFEPFSEEVDKMIEFVRNNPQYSAHGEWFDAFNEQENSNDLTEFLNSNYEQTSADEDYITANEIFIAKGNKIYSIVLLISTFLTLYEVTDDELRATVRSLNAQQRYAYDIIFKLVQR